MSVAANQVLRVGGLEIEPGLREVRRDGASLRLRPKTFDLLVYLATHPDRVLTKEELLEHLWKETKVTENSLVQCVIELRKTLGDDARQPRFIQTVAKAGYRFVGPVEFVEPVFVPAEAAGDKRLPRRPRRWLWPFAATTVLAAAVLVTIPWRLQPSGPPRNGEVAWWTFDVTTGGRVIDTVKGASAPLPEGAVRVPGIGGSAIFFDGKESVVHGRGLAGLPRGTHSRTLSAWIKTDTTNADSTVFFFYGNPAPNRNSDGFYLMLHQSGRAVFGNYYSSILSRDRVDDDRWHHIAGVFDGGVTGSARLFIDGSPQAEGTVQSSARGGPVSDWTIGRANWGGTSFRGAVDNVRIYERPLRPAEIQSLHRCESGVVDFRAEGGAGYYFASILGPKTSELSPAQAGESSARVRSPTGDFGGITFVAGRPGCPLADLRAADVGQDLTIEAELRVQRGPGGEIAEGGPYFRSRRAAPGDGIVGGTSAGYWVLLLSTGQVRIRRLHPDGIVAFSDPPASFDSEAFHRIEAAAVGDTLQVKLDGRQVLFEAGGRKTAEVPIPPVWEAASPPGTNHGGAGVAFASEALRYRFGGNEARNIRFRRFQAGH